MTPQSDVFDLIKSLSPTGKRYFKIYAQAIGGRESSGYLKLFDFLDTLPVYDESLVKKKFKNERFIRQLSVLKNYLYDLILRSMVHGSREYHPAAEMQMQLASVQLLYEAGLHKSCIKRIRKLKEKAGQQEEFGVWDKLCDWEIRILMNEANTSEAIVKAEEQIEVQKKRLADLNFKLKSLQVYDYTNKGELFTETKKGKLPDLYTALDQKPPHEADCGILGKYYYHTALKILSKQLSKEKEELFHAGKAMRLLESNPHFLEANMRLYITVMYNYSIVLTSQKKFSLLKDFVQEKKKLIRQLSDERHRELKHVAEVMLFNITILLYINGELPALPRNSVAIAQKYIAQSRNYANAFHILELCRNMMNALFMDEAYEDALFFLNEVLNNNRYKQVPLAYARMRYWELFIHHELGNAQMVKSLTNNLIRLLRKQQLIKSFDQKFISFLKTTEPANKAALLHQLISDLEKNNPSSTFSIIQDEIPLETWLMKKLSKFQEKSKSGT